MESLINLTDYQPACWLTTEKSGYENNLNQLSKIRSNGIWYTDPREVRRLFQAHNKITVADADHAATLEERFKNAAERMKAVPGFVKFGMLKAQDGSHYIVSTLWETEQHFKAWVSSPHFQAAHSGQAHPQAQAEVSSYHVIY